MLLLFSPSKKQAAEPPPGTALHTQPLFVEQAAQLTDLVKQKPDEEIARLMKLSEALTELNVQRYAQWETTFTPENSRPCLLAFDGDVYEGLAASSLSDEQLQWAQEHLAILSGLYGVLRPLDLMQPYRLEMGTRLENPAGSNLYAFWGDQLARYIDQRLQGRVHPVVINLASQEYFKAVDQKALKAPVIECVFQDYSRGEYKVIGFYAKKARGLMARFVIDNKIESPDGLQEFDSEGYSYAQEESDDARVDVRRRKDDD